MKYDDFRANSIKLLSNSLFLSFINIWIISLHKNRTLHFTHRAIQSDVEASQLPVIYFPRSALAMPVRITVTHNLKTYIARVADRRSNLFLQLSF